MDPSVIPAVSVGLSMAQTKQSVDITLLKNAMDLTEQCGDLLIQNLNNLSPYIGQNMDTIA